MSKGFFFSFDAMLGIAMILLLLAGTAILSLGAQKGGSPEGVMYAGAADNADKGFLNLDNSQLGTVPANAIMANCKEVYDYAGNGAVTLKVRKCKTLG